MKDLKTDWQTLIEFSPVLLLLLLSFFSRWAD